MRCRLHLAVLVGVFTGVALLAGSQDNANLNKFDVASVKRNTSGDNIIANRWSSPTRFVIENLPLKFVIEQAYLVKPYQIVGGPGWIRTERFDIVATTTSRGPHSPKVLAEMLRALLEERFSLRVHQESRLARAYILTTL